MTSYGVLSETVAVAGSLIAAASAIGFTWMRRVEWLPPEEAVPGGTVRISALICTVVIGLLYVKRDGLGFAVLSWIACLCLFAAVASLLTSIFINTTFSFTRKLRTSSSRSTTTIRILGGWSLTDEAKSLRQGKLLTVQQLYENANYQADTVWTKPSQALVLVASTLGFIVLQAGGSIALASAALIVSVAT